MPTYDFKCIDCNNQFQHLELPPIQAPLAIACPTCESKNTQKMISAPNVKFKGSGFYVTDSKKEDSQKKQ